MVKSAMKKNEGKEIGMVEKWFTILNTVVKEDLSNVFLSKDLKEVRE